MYRQRLFDYYQFVDGLGRPILGAYTSRLPPSYDYIFSHWCAVEFTGERNRTNVTRVGKHLAIFFSAT